MTKYGILQDAHNRVDYLRRAVNVLRNEKVDAVIVNGDVMEKKKNMDETIAYASSVLEELASINSEIYIGPKNAKIYNQVGSHESVALFDYMMSLYSSKYPNMISTLKENKIHNKDHDIVFLPGSDWVSGGQHQYTKDLKTGLYVLKGKNLKYEKFKSVEKFNKDVEAKKAHGIIYTANMNDLKKLVKDPDKTVIVSHVPAKFDNIDTAVDVAFFGQDAKGSVIPGMHIAQTLQSQYGRLNFNQMKQLAKAQDIDLKIENRGNEYLRKMFDTLGIKFAVSGHFHESTQRAHNKKCEKVKEGKWLKELFWNAGYLDVGHFGILEVKGNKVKYNNIKLK